MCEHDENAYRQHSVCSWKNNRKLSTLKCKDILTTNRKTPKMLIHAIDKCMELTLRIPQHLTALSLLLILLNLLNYSLNKYNHVNTLKYKHVYAETGRNLVRLK